MKRRRVINVIAIIVIVSTTFVMLRFFSEKEKASVLNKVCEEKILEYGTPFLFEVTDYIDLEGVSKKKQDKILSNIQIQHNITNQLDKEYPQVGINMVTVNYKGKEKNVTVNIQDTTAPKFEKLNIETDQYEELEKGYETYIGYPLDIELFNATDLSTVELYFDESLINWNEEGDYILKVIAKDESENIAEFEANVKVKAPLLNLNKSSIQLTEGGTFQLKVEVQGMDSTVNFISLDNQIASVDENGKIKAITKGETTIVVSANNVEKKCKVIVKEVPKVVQVSNSNKGPVNIDEMKQSILEYLNYDTQNIGIYYKNLVTGEVLSINAEQEFRSASVKKLMTANYCYYLVSQNKLGLNDEVIYTQDCYEGGTGIIQKKLNTQQVYTIEYLLKVLITHSDNIAYHMLNKHVGGVHSMIEYNRTHAGYQSTHSSTNYMSALDGAKVLMDINNSGHTKCMNDLKNTVFHDRLDKYISVPVAHKIGTYGKNIHDVGIVYASSPYVISIFTYGKSSGIIADLSKIIYSYH